MRAAADAAALFMFSLLKRKYNLCNSILYPYLAYKINLENS